MNDDILKTVAIVRKQVQNAKYDKGELSGEIEVNNDIIADLLLLSKSNIIENIVIRDNVSVLLEEMSLGAAESFKAQLVLYTKNITVGTYYESSRDFIRKNQNIFPNNNFYINNLDYYQGEGILPSLLLNHKKIIALISLLIDLSDYVEDNFGRSKNLIFFQKRKLNLIIEYGQGNLKNIDYLDDLIKQLTEAHDKEERSTIFKTEMIGALIEIEEKNRFTNLISKLDNIYQSYLKSHLLYLEKFSYQDLKSSIDKDKLDYTKRIYATVNDIQTKLIALPAAFLLVFSQFDYKGIEVFKNGLIVFGALLFSILLEILLRNQFGVLEFIKIEIINFKKELSNKDTSIDISEFTKSFGDLEPLIKKQSCYLWLFRVIIWVVPLVAMIMFLKFLKY